MPLVRYAVPEEFYYDPYSYLSNEDNYSLLVTRLRSGPGINVKNEIQEALGREDRKYVLKLAGSFERLIQDNGIHVKTTTFTAYQRYLVYCCSVYYNLAFGVDYTTLGIFIVRTPTSRIPPLRIADMIPRGPELSVSNLRLAELQIESTQQMPEGPIVIRNNLTQFRTTTPNRGAAYEAAIVLTEAPPNGNDTRPEGPVPVGILTRTEPTPAEKEIDVDSNNNLTATQSESSIPERRRMTLAEREAAYQEARRRIFGETPLEDDTDSHLNNSPDSQSNEEGDSDDVPLRIPNDQSTFSRLMPPLRPAKVPSNADPTTDKHRSFEPNLEGIKEEKENVIFLVPASSPGSFPFDEDLDISDVTSVTSGPGSVYSYASSRTRSTDYGLYYTRRALTDPEGSFYPLPARPDWAVALRADHSSSSTTLSTQGIVIQRADWG